MAKPKETASAERRITIPPINKKRIQITLVADSSLVTHKWSDKAKREMLDKQMKKAKQAKEAKDPWKDFCESMYWLTKKPADPKPEDIKKAKFGFPAVAFKSAAVTACTQTANITKVMARQAFHVVGDLVEIQGPPPEMREDMVRIGNGVADVRYRGEFLKWKVTLVVEYNANVISAEQVINLFNLAGFGVGIGEGRPEKDQDRGRFHVATEREVAP